MDYKFENLPDIWMDGKVIPKNFGRIPHLTGSKMIDNKDILLDEEAQIKFIKHKDNPKDLVAALEKMDGMNAGVVKADNGLIYPTNRKGYDCRRMGEFYKDLEYLGLVWAVWVDKHYKLYDSILGKGERLAFENCILIHSIRYNFKDTDPVFLLAKYTSDGIKMNLSDTNRLAIMNGIATPPVLNIGAAIPPELLLQQYPKGLAGSRDGIEGIVYNYEKNNRHEACAKYVSNPLIGSRGEEFVPNKFNGFKYRLFD